MGIDEYSILKKKPKKNAFAATALLISIAIALLVMVGAVLLLSKVNDNDRITPKDNGSETGTTTSNDGTTCEGLVKEIVFNDNLNNIKEAAISYFTNERLPKEIGDTVKITLKDMTDKKLVRTVYDASANACDVTKSYVEVTKEADEYVMKIFLSCSDIEDYIVVHLGCYDYCDKDVCEKKEEIPKVYEYQYKKTTSCVMSDWSKWGSWKTTREKTSNLKKEDTKVEKTTKQSVDTKDAIANISYNCDKYGKDYKLVGTSCVKATTITDTKPATKNKDTYNCNKYSSEYKLVGTECVRNYTEKDTKQADKNPTTYNCNKYGSEYKVSGNQCIRKYTTTETLAAEAVYSTRKVTRKFTCYKQECTTKTEFGCPTNGSCGNQLVTSCETVKKTCSQQVDEEYISDYKCKDDSYTKSQDKDGNWICTRQVAKTDTKEATPNPTTYNCDRYSGYTKVGSTCTKDVPKTDKKAAEKNPATYNCDKYPGYDVSGTNCVKVLPSTDTKEATEKVTYSCPVGYDRKDKICSKTTKEEVKTTYYRYATRTCNGGSTSIKWSTSKNDTILKSEGYKLTGTKREVKDTYK